MKTVDARGMLCPKPLMLTRKALMDLQPDDALEILIDNQVSADNVLRYLRDHGLQPTVEQEGDVTHLRLNTTKGMDLGDTQEELTCPTGAVGGHVVVVKSRTMGSGAPELGEILMKAFLNTLPEVQPLPTRVVFYNAGIHWALRDSDVLGALEELARKGVTLLVCGTCLQFYEKADQLAVGHASNMYEIAESLSRASSVVIP